MSRVGSQKSLSTRFGAVAVVLGLAVFTSGHGVARAEPDESGARDASTSQSDSDRKDPPASPVGAGSPSASTPDKGADDASPTKARQADTAEATEKPTTKPDEPAQPTTKAEETSEPTTKVDEPTATPETPASEEPASEEPAPTPDSPKSDAPEPTVAPSASKKAPEPAAAVTTTKTATTTAVTITTRDTEVEEPSAPAVARLAAVTPQPTVTALRAAAVEAAAVEPGPVSPIAEIAALPGRIVNAVLQVLGITTSASTGTSPFSPAPFADLFFAVFRRIEEAFGFNAPVVQPVPPAMVYEGPLDVATPTVKQFLDAATTEYVLGGTPVGMVPFTVNGWPMTLTHLETGSDASVWVTPENQIIIAYSGTTGGTNLLFNPLIAITQIITDLQVGLGTETPLAFTQAVDFAEAVKAEAAARGYAVDDIFVTGHSLGAWQAQYVAQQMGLNGIGFEGPGLNSTVPGNGADSLFVNVATYGDMAGFLSSDLPGLYPIAPPYVPGGGSKPHYGPIVLLGDPSANTPVVNAASLWGKGIIGTLISAIDLFGNFFAKHLPGVQAYHLDVQQDPGVVPWLGINEGPVYTGFGDLSIPELLKAASDKGILVKP